MLYLNSYYGFASFLYDKSCNLISPFLSMISNGIYMPNTCEIDIIISRENFNLKKNKNLNRLVNTVETNLDKIKELLLSRFTFGASRFISMFKQKQLKFINGKLKIYINSIEDLNNLVKVWFLLNNEKCADKFINRINVNLNLDNNLRNNELLIDTSQDLKRYLDKLIDNKDISVVCQDENLVICNIKSRDLIKLLNKYGLILLDIDKINTINIKCDKDENKNNIRINRYLFCIDENLYFRYKHLFKKVCSTVEFTTSFLNFYCVFIDKDFNLNTQRIYAKSIEDLLKQNFKFNVDVVNIFSSSLKEDRHFISDIIMDNNFKLSYNASDNSFTSQQKALNYGLDIYGISGRNNMFLSTNKLSINLGLELCLNRDISVSNMLCDIQSENSDAWFCKYNKSLSRVLNHNKNILDRIISLLVLFTNSSIKIFDRNYVHGFVKENDIAILYNSHRWPINRLIDSLSTQLSKRVNLNFNNFMRSFLLNNLIYSLSFKNLFISRDGIQQIKLCDYSEESLLNVSHSLDLYGYRNVSSYSSIFIPGNIISSLFSTKFIQILYRLNNNSSVAVRLMSKSVPYKNLVINNVISPISMFNTTNVTQVMLENNCLLPVYSVILDFVSSYFMYEIDASRVVSQRLYANKSCMDVFSDSSILKFSVYSTKLLEKLYLKNINFKFDFLCFINSFNKSSYSYTFFTFNKKLNNNDLLSLTFGSLCNSFRSEISNIKIINMSNLPDFLSQNAIFVLRNYDICNKVMIDFITMISYIKRYKMDICRFDIIYDFLSCKMVNLSEMRPVCYIDLAFSYSKHIVKILNVGSLYLVFNFKFLRDNFSFISFKFLSNVN